MRARDVKDYSKTDNIGYCAKCGKPTGNEIFCSSCEGKYTIDDEGKISRSIFSFSEGST